jgi:small subunit ribosomal protein S4
VNHGHILVNDRKVDIPSFQVKPGDVISVREASRKNSHIESAWQTASGRGRPSWITADGGEMTARVASSPVRDDIDRLINEQLIVELYSK